MSEAVQNILERIEQLSVEDRLLLDDCLAQKEEAEWRRETDAARQFACERGINQEAIDRAIEKRRYGS